MMFYRFNRCWWPMIFTKFFLLLLFVLVSTFAVQAVAAPDTEVYKTVDENGDVTFSDKQTKDAEIIEVQPNIVDVDVPAMPAPTVQEATRNQPSGNQIEIQQEAVGRGTAEGANLRRRVRNETNGEGIDRPGGVVTPYGREDGRPGGVVTPRGGAGGLGGRR